MAYFGVRVQGQGQEGGREVSDVTFKRFSDFSDLDSIVRRDSGWMVSVMDGLRCFAVMDGGDNGEDDDDEVIMMMK